MQQASQAKEAYYNARHWAKQHRMHPPMVALPQALQEVIEEWFNLVDVNNSGCLTRDELEATFKV